MTFAGREPLRSEPCIKVVIKDKCTGHDQTAENRRRKPNRPPRSHSRQREARRQQSESRADIPPTRASRNLDEWSRCPLEFSSPSHRNISGSFVSCFDQLAIFVPLLNAEISSTIVGPTWKNNEIRAEIFSVILHDEVERCEGLRTWWFAQGSAISRTPAPRMASVFRAMSASPASSNLNT